MRLWIPLLFIFVTLIIGINASDRDVSCSNETTCACENSDCFSVVYNCQRNNTGSSAQVEATTKHIHDLVIITCLQDHGDWSTILADSGIDASLFVKPNVTVTIYNCSLPEKPIISILSEISIQNIWKVSIAKMKPSKNRFQDKGNILNGLSNLTRLVIETTILSSLSAEYFEPVPKVIELSMANNNLTQLPPDIFKYLKELRKLRITQNQLNDISPQIFSYIPNLKLLDLSSNSITSLSTDVFLELRNLESLTINENNLTVLPGSLFENCMYLKEVHIGNNKLTHLNEMLFQGLPQLEKLILSNNQLEFISNACFEGLISLEILDLQNNMLKKFDPLGYLDEFFPSLQIINLNNNELGTTKNDNGNNASLSQSSECKPEYELTIMLSEELQRIQLRNNSLRSLTIKWDWKVACRALVLLDVSHNKLDFFYLKEFRFYTLQGQPPWLIDLSYNELKTLDMYNLDPLLQPKRTEKNCPGVGGWPDHNSLEVLLRNNPLTCDCLLYDLILFFQHKTNTTIFRYLTMNTDDVYCMAPPRLKNTLVEKVNLNEMLCSMNETKPGSTICPTNCTCSLRIAEQVLIIDCSNQGKPLKEELPEVNKVILRNDRPVDLNGAELMLSNNNIKSWDELPKTLPNNTIKLSLSSNSLMNINNLQLPPKLKVMELHNNKLSHLDEDTTKILSHINLTLSGNPWKCECETIHLWTWIRSNYQQITDVNKVFCAGKTKPILEYDEGEYCKRYLTEITICALSIISIFSLLSLIYYKYQYEIKVYMFAHKIFLPLVRKKETNVHKEYDAFVSYSHLDEDFVTQQLQPELENGSTPFKLCLHFRDWTVGDYIPDQITRSVENSRRTIVVLSPNYLNSVWGKLEFRTAHLRAMKEGHVPVIVILLEDIGRVSNLDPGLRIYLKMNTYLKWGDPWFWNKLKYAMPHRQQELTATKRTTRGSCKAATAEENNTELSTLSIDDRRFSASERVSIDDRRFSASERTSYIFL